MEPDLDGSLGHVDFGSDTLSRGGIRGRVLVELYLKSDELILSGSLSLLIFLLLSQGALARRPSRSVGVGRGVRI